MSQHRYRIEAEVAAHVVEILDLGLDADVLGSSAGGQSAAPSIAGAAVRAE